MKCVVCNKELSSGDSNNICFSCKNRSDNLSNIRSYQIGWICPKCGNVYGPFISECYKCNPSRELNINY